MNRKKRSRGYGTRDDSAIDTDSVDYDAGVAIVGRLLHTREVRRLLGAILPDLLHLYAGNSRVRKFLADGVGRHFVKTLSPVDDTNESREIEKLFQDDAFVRDVAETLPDLLNSALGLASMTLATVESFETEDKKKLFENLLSRPVADRTGDLVTRGCRILNDIHKNDPEFFTRMSGPGFQRWIEAIDFGEIKEAVDNSTGDLRAFVIMANTALWKYPAKVLLLLSLLPPMVNMLTDSLEISLNRMNELPADLLTDVVLSLIREIDAPNMGNLVNETTELARKINTGSSLLGEPGSPQLPRILADKVEEVVGRIDPATLWKARLAWAETGSVIKLAMTDAVNSRPDLKQLFLLKRPELTNLRIKTHNQAISWWDNMDDGETADSISKSFSAYDVQELGELINNLLRLFNRTGDHLPEFWPGLIEQFMSAIDDDELAGATANFFGVDNGKVSPAARAVVPRMVLWVADALAPADDMHEETARQARIALRNLFSGEEA